MLVYFVSFFLLIKISISQLVYVNTSRGQIFGYHEDFGPIYVNNPTQLWYGSGDVFLGVPYVQPPIREHRFKVDLSVNHLKKILFFRNLKNWINFLLLPIMRLLIDQLVLSHF
jgi:hypothetical protein